MEGEGVLELYYDCQICDDKHRIISRWKEQDAVDLKKFHGVTMEEEMMDSILRFAEETFKDKHPKEVFIKERLKKENV